MKEQQPLLVFKILKTDDNSVEKGSLHFYWTQSGTASVMCVCVQTHTHTHTDIMSTYSRRRILQYFYGGFTTHRPRGYNILSTAITRRVQSFLRERQTETDSARDKKLAPLFRQFSSSRSEWNFGINNRENMKALSGELLALWRINRVYISTMRTPPFFRERGYHMRGYDTRVK